MPIRVAVIGTSFGGMVQIPGFRRLEDVEVVAVASGHLSRAQEVAARYGIPHAFDDYRAMLDAVDVDLVSVVTPPYLHHEVVMEAARRGKHVLCEKPFALSIGQAREMLQAVERAGVVHALDHEFRFLPSRAALKRLVDQGYLGEPRLVRIVWRNDNRSSPDAGTLDWWSQREKGGGILGAVGSHYLDSLRWWFGEVREVAAALDALVPRRRLPDGSGWGEVTADDTATLLLHVGTAQATLSVTAVAGPRGNRVEAHGSAGTLVIQEDEQLLGAQAGQALAELSLEPEQFPPLPSEPRPVRPFAELAHRVVARIRGQGELEFPTFRDGAAVRAILDAAQRSADERRWVEPESV